MSRADLNPSLAHPLLYGVPAARVIRQTRVPGLDLITGSSELGDTDLALREVKHRELCLRALVEPLRRRYRAILIDCPPGLSLLQVNALAAAARFLVPVAPQYLSIPQSGAVAEASSFGQTIFQYQPASPAAEAYRRLTREVLQRLRRAN